MQESGPPPPTESEGPVRRAVRHAFARRPASFYMLLAIPVVMLLAVPLFEYREDPRRFAFLLAMQFIFLGIVLVRALLDLIEIGVRRYKEERDNFKNTLGEEAFYEELGRRVKGDGDE